MNYQDIQILYICDHVPWDSNASSGEWTACHSPSFNLLKSMLVFLEFTLDYQAEASWWFCTLRDAAFHPFVIIGMSWMERDRRRHISFVIIPTDPYLILKCLH